VRHLGGDRAGPRLGLPAGWLEVAPGAAPVPAVAGAVQVITVSAWDEADGARPMMSLSLTAPGREHAATQVLTDARASYDGLHVVSIDPWPVPGAPSSGRRLVLAHAEDDQAVTTLAWVAGTAAGGVVVTARVESIHLHRHEADFREALAGVDLREQSPPGDPGSLADGEVAPDIAYLVDVVPAAPWRPPGASAPLVLADPDARILVEASVAATSLSFDATVLRGQAAVTATASPRTVRTPGAAAAGPAARTGATTFRLPVALLPLAIAQWLGLGPSSAAPAAPITVPIRLVMNRLVDPSVPPPDGADPVTWEQPWFLWTLRSSATDSGLVVVDTGATGQCAVMETADEETTRFAPLSSYNVWLTLNWLVSESLGHG
jgi:hypothetical protein